MKKCFGFAVFGHRLIFGTIFGWARSPWSVAHFVLPYTIVACVKTNRRDFDWANRFIYKVWCLCARANVRTQHAGIYERVLLCGRPTVKWKVITPFCGRSSPLIFPIFIVSIPNADDHGIVSVQVTQRSHNRAHTPIHLTLWSGAAVWQSRYIFGWNSRFVCNITITYESKKLMRSQNKLYCMTNKSVCGERERAAFLWNQLALRDYKP